MPFTLAHPAAIIPIRRLAGHRTPLSALVLGSMMPDLGYFFPVPVPGALTHSIPGIFLFCLPAGLLVYLLFHALLRSPLIALAPDAIANRLEVGRQWAPATPAALLAVLASIALGAATHIGWDAFTHANTAVARHLDFLRAPVGLAGGQVPVFKLLQYFSGVFGLAVLGTCIARWMRHTPPVRQVPARRYRLPAVALIVAAGVAGGAATALSWQGVRFERLVFGAVTGAMAAMTLALLLFCAGWHVRRFWRGTQNRSNSPK